jgi:hypothetical protein
MNLFALKIGGKQVQAVDLTAVGIFDIVPWYIAGSCVNQVGNVTPVVTAQSFVQALVVPAGQVWLCDAIGFTTTTGAGAGGAFTLCYNLPGSGNQVPISNQITVAASQVGLWGAKITPIAFTAGTSINVHQISASGAAFAIAPASSANLRALVLNT